MKPVVCPRLFEAEAMRDGRLAGAALTSFARHATLCEGCRREVQALDSLAEALRASGGSRVDELHALRARTRLVAAFDGTLRSPAAGRGARPFAFAAAVTVVAALVAGGGHLWRRDRGLPLAPSTGVVVQAGGTAVWSQRTDRGRQTVTFDHGELWIHVDHARTPIGLVVELPDGELEDTGTTFTVSAANGRTTRVEVHEGSVVLRLRGRPPVAIAGGNAWTPPPAERSTPVSFLAPAEKAPAGETEPPRRALVPGLGVSRRREGIPTGVPTPAPEPAIEFRAAVAVLDAGAHREAAAAFARFLAEHPGDARAEDAAYLLVIASERAGDVDETRRAARAYLRLYPAGFRRTEIERLSR